MARAILGCLLAASVACHGNNPTAMATAPRAEPQAQSLPPEEPAEPATDEDASEDRSLVCAQVEAAAVVDGALDDLGAWTLRGAVPLNVEGDGSVLVDDVFCAEDGGEGGLMQRIRVPTECAGLLPAYGASIYNCGVGDAGGEWRMRIEGEVVAPAPLDFPRCFGDAHLGKDVDFFVGGVALPHETPCSGGCPFVRVGEVGVRFMRCPFPGEVAPLEEWFVSRVWGEAHVEGNAHIVVDAPGWLIGPHGGAVSIPSSFAHPALVATGAATGVVVVFVDDRPVGAWSPFQGEARFCVPAALRGRVASLMLDVESGTLALDGLEIVDDEACAHEGIVPPRSSWWRVGLEEAESGALLFRVGEDCDAGAFTTAVVMPPHASIRVTYAATGPLKLGVFGMTTLAFPATDGVVVTEERCVAPQFTGALVSLSVSAGAFEPFGSGIISTGPTCDGTWTYEAALHEFAIVEDASCP